MAREAGLGQHLPAENGLPPTWIGIDLATLERFAHLVIEDFLQRSGQYVTNDASRKAAIQEAVEIDRRKTAEIAKLSREWWRKGSA